MCTTNPARGYVCMCNEHVVRFICYLKVLFTRTARIIGDITILALLAAKLVFTITCTMEPPYRGCLWILNL